jgi:hypothetical protein
MTTDVHLVHIQRHRENLIVTIALQEHIQKVSLSHFVSPSKSKPSTESGVPSCIAARAGYYVPTPGATTEMACQQGTYSASTGSTSCATCPPGYQCPSNALSSPQRCSPGRYSTGGLTECVKCSAGTFNDIQGATSCCDCAAGWYNVSSLHELNLFVGPTIFFP